MKHRILSFVRDYWILLLLLGYRCRETFYKWVDRQDVG